MFQKYSIIILSSLLLFACSSGENRLEKGQYDLAVYKAVKRLQQNPDHKKASVVLQKSYTHAVDQHMENIRGLDYTTDGTKWEKMVYEYEMIDYLNNVIRSYPQYTDLVQLVDVKEELSYTKNAASNDYKQKGIDLLAKGTKEYARMAFAAFERADYFSPGKQEILDLILEAREAGTLNVSIEFPGDEPNAYLIPTKDLYYEIQQYSSGLNFNFLRIVSPDNPYYDVDQIIQLHFEELLIGNVFVDRSQEHIIRDNILIGETQVNDSTKAPVYGKVTADFRTYRKTINSSGALVMQIIDASTSAVVFRKRYPASYNWVSEWADFRGDERALSEKQLKLTNIAEPIPPSMQWLFGQLSRPMFNASTQDIKRQYAYLR